MYWTLLAYLELPRCLTNSFWLPNDPTNLCEIQYQWDNKGEKRAQNWSKFKVVEEQMSAEISRMKCQIKKSLIYSWTLSKTPGKKKSAGPRDQFPQKCKFTKSPNSIFAWNCDSQKFEITHIRGNWSPGLLDFFLHGFLQQLHGISTEFRSGYSRFRSRVTFAPRWTLQGIFESQCYKRSDQIGLLDTLREVAQTDWNATIRKIALDHSTVTTVCWDFNE